MASYYDDLIEVAANLQAVRLTFEDDLRAGLKAELMRLAEERIDAIVDETVKALQTRVDGAQDVAMQRALIQFTIKREAGNVAAEPAPVS